MVKKSIYNARDTRDAGSLSGLGRSPGACSGNLLSILTWKIPWTKEPGRLQFMGSQRVGHDRATELDWTELN